MLRATVYLLLLGPSALAVLGPRLARHLAPSDAVRTLTALTLAATGATVWGLTTLAIGGLGRTDDVQAYVRSNPVALAADDPVPRVLGILAVALLAIGLARAAHSIWRRRQQFRALAALRTLPAVGDLLILDQPYPDAYALPGRPPRIVVTSAMLRALPAEERRVMLAHERAHLRHRHHYYTAAADVAAAINPLLRRLRDHIAFQAERWADEEAAHATGSRTIAARSLARAALAVADATRVRKAGAVLAYLRHKITARVGALQAERPTSRWIAALPAATVTILTALAFAEATSDLARCLFVLHLT
ncbi:M56 family metallopeptidase [Streptomyces silvisoli]|uniref:M56 family metallopeptidase n=1 Tax=Streptomyces silvisoli TaxID=3034235 RepID=A0ABT5ZP43_9ACTN|nr:M56 family metallopeptidase [Streptomyces silvisoli]MDF3291600.1 M56 family metallopeptidase [Streptomyces silvisoli]